MCEFNVTFIQSANSYFHICYVVDKSYMFEYDDQFFVWTVYMRHVALWTLIVRYQVGIRKTGTAVC